MKLILKLTALIGLLFSIVSVAAADRALQVQAVKLAIPFGQVSGQAFVLGDHFVFVDTERPEGSFALERSQMGSFDVQEDRIRITMSIPIADRSGERTEFVFKVSDPAAFVQWAEMEPSESVVLERISDDHEAETVDRVDRRARIVFPARHNHRLGSCQGQLLITDDLIAYESVGKLGHSRQWQFSDIKTLKLDNPYKLEIRGFSGGNYELELQGKGMDTQQYRELVEKVTSARLDQ